MWGGGGGGGGGGRVWVWVNAMEFKQIKFCFRR